MKLSEKEKQFALESLVSKNPELQQEKTFMKFMDSAFSLGYEYQNINKRFNLIRSCCIFLFRIILTLIFAFAISLLGAPIWACILSGLVMSYFCSSK